MRRWFAAMMILAAVSSVFFIPMTDSLSQEMAIEPEILEISNKIMQDLFAEIKAAQPEFKELANFSDENFFKNAQGIYTIQYQYTPKTEGAEQMQQELPYAMGITIDGLDQWTFPPRKKMFNYGFPLLNVKISGYQEKHPIRTQFDINPLVKKYGQILADEQQKLMPLTITVEPTQPSFSTREQVEVDIILRNVSKRHMYVRPLNKDTLYFLIDDQFWGTKPTEGAPKEVQSILYSGEEIHMRYRIGVFQQPQTIHIMCFYRMGISGVNPFGKSEVSIVKP